MTFDDVRAFLEEHHQGVAVTFRGSGAAQASLVVCGLQDEPVFRCGVAQDSYLRVASLIQEASAGSYRLLQ